VLFLQKKSLILQFEYLYVYILSKVILTTNISNISCFLPTTNVINIFLTFNLFGIITYGYSFGIVVYVLLFTYLSRELNLDLSIFYLVQVWHGRGYNGSNVMQKTF